MADLDSRPSASGDSASGLSIGTRLDRVCEVFESEWRRALRGDGERPQIERFLEDVAAQERWAFLRELVLTDQQYRELAGEVVDTRAYETRFAQFADLIQGIFRRSAALQRVRDYRLLEVIGRGGMGVVYKAQHLRLGKIRAIKILARHLLDNREAVERFRLEIENCGRLDHPNIVQALDAGEEHDIHFLVMEYVSGWNLTRIVETFHQARKRLPVDIACELARQAAVGLQHAHHHFLVHRDLKPSNLMLSQTGVVKILDLGLARFIAEQQPATRLTISPGPMGTCDYMAPEQWDDASSVDIRADLYSLGCTLHYLLTGKPPYGGDERRGLLQKQLAHQHSPIPSLFDERDDVPETLQAVLERLMAKSPENRFAEPVAAADALVPFTRVDSIGVLVEAMQQPSQVREQANFPELSSAPSDTGRSRRRRNGSRAGAKGRVLRKWYQQLSFWLAIAIVMLAAAALPRWFALWFNGQRSRVQAVAELSREVALLPGLNGQWWFDEMPWYAPFVRARVAEAVGPRNFGNALAYDHRTYLNPDVLAVQKWLLDAAESCQDQFSAPQRRLFEELKTAASEQLDDADLERHLQAGYQAFSGGRVAAADWSADDLYTRAVLEHKLAELRHDLQLARQALKTYDAALDRYHQLRGPPSGLELMCRSDSARLCDLLLTDYEGAYARYETVVTAELPLLLHVDTLAAYSQAGRANGDYDKDENLRLAKRLLESSTLSRNHPLWAHVSERHAWSLMDQWFIQEAFDEFEAAHSIRLLNWKENPLAAIYVFHNLHGKAMTQRYRGRLENARAEYDELLDKIRTESKKAEQRAKRPGLQRYVRDLQERESNALERRADCELYQGAASDPDAVDLDLAAGRYQEASELASDPGAKAVQACKRCVVLALSGDVETARVEFSQDDVSHRAVVGAGRERVHMLRQLTAAVLAWKEEGPEAGYPALRQFLVQFDRHPYHLDRLRRETLELQLFAAELLLSSEWADEDTRRAAEQDVEHLDVLLRQFEKALSEQSSGDELLPFLRRYYDIAITVVGDRDADRAAHLMLALRGPEDDRDPDSVKVLFHLHEHDGLAVVVPPDGSSTAFRLPECGRQQVKQPKGRAAPRKFTLPQALLQLVRSERDAGRKIECLWTDGQCWSESQRHQALTLPEFPFAELRGLTTVR
jgi:serine/threonine protein kinase